MNEIIIYENGNVSLNVAAEGESIWLSQKQMGELFNRNTRTISEHISNIFKVNTIKLTPFAIEDFKLLLNWIKNEEEMVQFSGGAFSYPLSEEQIKKYLNDKLSYAFNVTHEDKIIGHCEICLENKNSAKLGKVIIGDKNFRNKGLGAKLIKEMLRYCFLNLHVNYIHLYVYDWNKGAIKCYEKCGFQTNEKTKITTFSDKIWTALDMEIDKDNWRNYE